MSESNISSEPEPQQLPPADESPPAPAPPPPASPPPAATGEPRGRGIRYNDRVLVLGQTGSGKSVLLNYLLCNAYRCQRLLVDTKDEFSVPGVEPVHDVGAIDWTQPLIHYIDDAGALREYNDLFRVCMQRKAGRSRVGTYGLVVCVHELSDLCGDSPGATPSYVSAYIRKGRAHGLGLLAGSQRPVNMPKAARTEAQHVFAFAPGFDDIDDRRIVAREMGMSDGQLDAALEAATRVSPTGEHAYLWWDQRAQPRTVIRAPLPEREIARVPIRGLDPHSRSTIE